MALETSGIYSVPKWTLHRRDIRVVDGSPPIVFATIPLSIGARADGFRWVIARWKNIYHAKDVKLRPLFADEETEQWVEDPGILETAVATDPYQFSFEARGRTFIIIVTAVLGISRIMDIHISGFGRY